jgi:acyl-CoA thioester hydrolase
MQSRIERQVYYHDTDAVGIMYYGAYLKILEEGRTDSLEKKGVFVGRLHEEEKYFVIKELNINYLSPARFGEWIICESYVERFTSARIFFKQRIANKNSGKHILDACVVLVVLNKQLKALRITKSIGTCFIV